VEITLLKQTGAESYIIELSSGESLKTVFTVVADFSLYTGRELSASELAAVREASNLGCAKQRALRIIGAAPMSEMSLFDRMVQKGESEKNAAECVAWLRGLGYLDDTQYARQLAVHYANMGYGKNRVRDELYRRKVPRALWDEALEAFPEPGEAIDTLLRAKLKSENPDRKELKRATDALLRRGFSWEEVKSAVRRFSDSVEEEL